MSEDIEELESLCTVGGNKIVKLWWKRRHNFYKNSKYNYDDLAIPLVSTEKEHFSPTPSATLLVLSCLYKKRGEVVPTIKQELP